MRHQNRPFIFIRIRSFITHLIIPSIWYPMYRKDVSIFSYNLVRLQWITMIFGVFWLSVKLYSHFNCSTANVALHKKIIIHTVLYKANLFSSVGKFMKFPNRPLLAVSTTKISTETSKVTIRNCICNNIFEKLFQIPQKLILLKFHQFCFNFNNFASISSILLQFNQFCFNFLNFTQT